MTHYDIAIIGGGLVGAAAGYYLAKAGAKAVVIDRGQIGAQASGQNAGSLHFQLEHRLIEHGDALAEQAAVGIPLNILAIDAWRTLEAELGADLEVELHGGLMVAESAAQLALLEKKFALEQKWRLPTALLDRDAVRSHAPYLSDNIIAAGYCAAEGHANPRLVTPAYARAAVARGAEIKVNTTVTALACVRQGWRISYRRAETSGHVTAAKVLNAGGAWCADVGALVNIHLPIYPVPLTMTVTEVAPPTVHHLIQHVGRRLSLKQVRDGNLLIGGGWRSFFRNNAGAFDHLRAPDQSLDAILGNMAVAVDVVPTLRDLSIIRSWTGTTGVTADQLPLLGPVAAVPDFYVAAGGSGFTLGPVYAQIIADMMLERALPLDVSLYGPNRFGHINAFMGTA